MERRRIIREAGMGRIAMRARNELRKDGSRKGNERRILGRRENKKAWKRKQTQSKSGHKTQ